MKPEWTTKYPTRPGLYWISNYRYKHPTGSVLVPGSTVVELDHDLDISFIGAEELHKPDYILSAEWFGPIQPPADNEAIYGLGLAALVNADQRAWRKMMDLIQPNIGESEHLIAYGSGTFQPDYSNRIVREAEK